MSRKILAEYGKCANKARIAEDSGYIGYTIGFTNNGCQWSEYPMTKDLAIALIQALGNFLELESEHD